jgi:ketosteroid isomerase-like protein
MNHADVQAWLDRYVEAWRANDRTTIEALFTDDAVYGYRPWDSDESTVRGSSAIADSWLEEPDAPGSWDAQYEPFAVEDDRAVALGWSRYSATADHPERTYHNAYVMRFAPDGRCREFHEFYMLQGDRATTAADA